MSLLRRNLTVHFQQSVTVTSTSVVPQTAEVSVIPLQDASNAATVATYVGGVQTVTVVLANADNPVTFALVPSNFPGLSNPINYRILWRIGGVTGRTQTYDFAMPDADIDFDQLQSTGAIIDGSAYLQQSDLGVAGRVAMLNNSGEVIDASGTPVATPADIATVQSAIASDIATVQAQAVTDKNYLLDEISSQVGSASSTASTNLNQAVSSLTLNLNEEKAGRLSDVGRLTSSLSSLSSTVSSNSSTLFSSVASINTTLTSKADLDDTGHIPIAQIPPAAITNWIPLSSASARLSLNYPNDVQPGDIALTPTGVYGLIGTDPSNTADWYLLNQVLSVNGKTGTITLSASDVGAISSSASIPQSQITGLSTTIAGLASNATATSLQSQITNIVGDTTIVRLNSNNQISSSYLDSGVAYVNGTQITTKSGVVLSDSSTRGVISINGQTGVLTLTASSVGAIPSSGALQSQVIGLSTTLALKADLVSGKVPLGQIPQIPESQVTNLTSDLSTRAILLGSSGPDPSGTVPVSQLPSYPISKVTGLSGIINSNGLSSLSNVVARITDLENRTSSSGTSVGYIPAVQWNSGGTGDNLSLSSFVLSSPFGIYGSGANAGSYYFNSAGVPSGDAAFPVITPGGHLKLYRWNDNNPPDPTYALQSDLSSLSNTVASQGFQIGLKANSSDLSTQTGRINTLSGSKADLDPITNTLSLSQVPFIAKQHPQVVSSLNDLQSLTTTQVHVGDQAIILSGTGMGTYTLVGSDPSQLGNSGWVQHPVPVSTVGGSSGGVVGTVTSISGVSGKIYPDSSGNISLLASYIGAASSSIQTTVNAWSASPPWATPAQVTSAIGTSQLVRRKVDFACTTQLAIGSGGAPSGSPQIDVDASGNPIYAQNGMYVLLTRQNGVDSSNNPLPSRLNGVWVVNTSGSSTWSRPTDYSSGSTVYPDTIILVNSSFSSSGRSNYTLWQNVFTAPSVVDSTTVNAQTQWSQLGSVAPVTVTGSGGINISGTYPNIVVGTGSSATFTRNYYTTIVPGTSDSSRTVTHNLNNLCPQVTVVEDSSGNFILVGWKTVGNNSVVLDFSPSVMTIGNTYRVTVQG